MVNEKEVSEILEIADGVDDLLEEYSLLLAERKLTISEVRDILLDFYLDIKAKG